MNSYRKIFEVYFKLEKFHELYMKYCKNVINFSSREKQVLQEILCFLRKIKIENQKITPEEKGLNSSLNNYISYVVGLRFNIKDIVHLKKCI